jgi:hypothetical protein
MLGHQLGGPPGQVALVCGQRVGALAGELEREEVGVADGHLVEQRHGVEHRGEVVIAVIAAVTDSQVEVDLPRHSHGDRTGGNPLRGGVPVRCGHRTNSTGASEATGESHWGERTLLWERAQPG